MTHEEIDQMIEALGSQRRPDLQQAIGLADRNAEGLGQWVARRQKARRTALCLAGMLCIAAAIVLIAPWRSPTIPETAMEPAQPQPQPPQKKYPKKFPLLPAPPRSPACRRPSSKAPRQR